MTRGIPVVAALVAGCTPLQSDGAGGAGPWPGAGAPATAGRTALDYWEILFEKDVIGDYYLDEREVTVAQFVAFIESDSFLDPALWVGLEGGSDLR